MSNSSSSSSSSSSHSHTYSALSKWCLCNGCGFVNGGQVADKALAAVQQTWVVYGIVASCYLYISNTVWNAHDKQSTLQ